MIKFLKTFGILLIVTAIFGGAMFALNLYTGPIIAQNNAGEQFAPLLAVMPEGAAFDGDALIYDKTDAASSTLVDVPESVLAVYKEATGLGYVIRCTAESQYSTAPMEITIGITADGKICGIEINSYNDTASFDFRAKDPAYLESYVGKDSALVDIGTVAGSTFSSTAFKNAVSEAMGVLISNNMIAAGVKADDQILQEMIPDLAPGFAKLTEATASDNFLKIFKAGNDAGFAYLSPDGDGTFLVLVNATGTCRVYDVEGKDVTASHATIAAKATAHATTNGKSFDQDLAKKIGKMMDGATDITSMPVNSINTVVAAASFTFEGNTYYAYMARPYGFDQMDVYFILDESGAIVEMEAKELIFEKEFFMAFGGVNESEYNAGFEGKTSDTWTEDTAVIATATMTSNAMKQATADVFAAFNTK